MTESTLPDLPKRFEMIYRVSVAKPTGGIQVYADCEIGANSLVLAVADDKYAHAKVRTFVGQVSSNLEALRDEIESLKPLVRIAMQRAAARTKHRFAIPNETDLDFPIED